MDCEFYCNLEVTIYSFCVILLSCRKRKLNGCINWCTPQFKMPFIAVVMWSLMKMSSRATSAAIGPWLRQPIEPRSLAQREWVLLTIVNWFKSGWSLEWQLEYSGMWSRLTRTVQYPLCQWMMRSVETLTDQWRKVNLVWHGFNILELLS